MDSRGIPEIINHIQLIHIERDTVQSVINNQLKLQMGVDSVGTFNTSTVMQMVVSRFPIR